MNIQQTIRRVLKEESEKQSRFMSNIMNDGLLQVMHDTGLSLLQIKSKTGELPREVYERYIKDFVKNEGDQLGSGSDADIKLIFAIGLSDQKEAESFYLSKGNLTVEIVEYDSNDRKVAGGFERLENLSDYEIYRLSNDMIEWGKDIYYEI